MSEQASGLRVYLAGPDLDVEGVAERIADLLVELGFNAEIGPEEKGLVTAVIAVVAEEEDVRAWAEGAEEFFQAISPLASFVLIPSNETETSEPMPDEKRLSLSGQDREKLRAAAQLLRQTTEGPDPHTDGLIRHLRGLADAGCSGSVRDSDGDRK